MKRIGFSIVSTDCLVNKSRKLVVNSDLWNKTTHPDLAVDMVSLEDSSHELYNDTDTESDSSDSETVPGNTPLENGLPADPTPADPAAPVELQLPPEEPQLSMPEIEEKAPVAPTVSGAAPGNHKSIQACSRMLAVF